MKVIYIMGKSASGKDTIFNILKQKLNVNTYVMYTTRPMRDGEEDGVNYYFISKEEMEKYQNGEMLNKLIESRTYQTAQGPWTYATIADEQFNSQKDMLMTGTLESYKKIKQHFGENYSAIIKPVYIEVPDRIRLERAILREEKQEEPKYVEMCRRFIADSKDFSNEKLNEVGIKKRFQNIELENCVKDIMEFLER